MEKYEFNNVGTELYKFIWEDFCDNYIELSKTNLENNTTKTVLLEVLTKTLKMLHPFMPYVTEEIYQKLPIKETSSIMISTYPKYEEDSIYKEEQLIDKVIEDITNIRNLKVTNNITKEAAIEITTTKEVEHIYKNMLKIKEENLFAPKEGEKYSYKSQNIEINYYQKGKEINKELLITEIEKLETSINKRKKLLSNENYINKAPEKVVNMDKQKLKEEQEKLETLKKQL